MAYSLALVGLGPAGIFTLASLPDSLLPRTLVIEQSCIGGELASHYGHVFANITKAEFLKILTSIPKWSVAICLTKELDTYTDTDTPPLYVFTNILRRLIHPVLQQAHFHTCTLSELRSERACPFRAPLGKGTLLDITRSEPSSEEALPLADQRLAEGELRSPVWTLTTSSNTFHAEKVILCVGATQKTLNFPIPTIPLHVALGPSLSTILNPNEPLIVFGTSHSGTLVLKQLKLLGATYVYAVHTGSTPFHSDLKHEAAAIVSEIQSGVWGAQTPTFISYTDTPMLYRALQKVTSIIYAIGFAPRYLSPTGLNDTTNMMCLGYCDPTQKDIGFAAFIQTIQERLGPFLALPETAHAP